MLKPLKGEIRKPTKTVSGITPVAVMLPPRKCKHGMCIYCPSLDVPQSYTPKSPVVLRASAVKYNPYKQVIDRIKAFQVMNHSTDKIELIIMGGTFLEYPAKFQNEFIKGCYDAMNRKKSSTLEKAKKLNEKSKHRCVALCIETRPDRCTVKDIKKVISWGATRVELGVQIPDDKIYKTVKRGHTIKDVISATERLKNAGFKIGYHIMPGLPGSSMKKDLMLFKKLFSDQRFRPDQLKIYPCQVIAGAELEKLFGSGKYKPYSKEQTEKILIQMLKLVPRYCRIMRVMREIPPEYIIAGTHKIDLRGKIEEEFRKNKIKLKEIRYREIGFAIRDKKDFNKNLKLKITKYPASGGEEYFLEAVNKDDTLFGLLRLRIFNSENSLRYRSEINNSEQTSSSSSFSKKQLVNNDFKHKDIISGFSINKSNKIRVSVDERGKSEKTAIIRELHVYGPSLKLGERSEDVAQHKGFGQQLMKEAEKIVKKNKIKKLNIISGVGVREYYRKLGYELDKEGYMIKEL